MSGTALATFLGPMLSLAAGAFTLPAPHAPLPKSTDPRSANLSDTIRKLNPDIAKIAGLHGPRLASLDDPRADLGQSTAAR
jgi:hypothetical protein